MRWGAILITGSRPIGVATRGQFNQGRRFNSLRPSFACVDLFGRSVLERTISTFRKEGAETISVIKGSEVDSLPKIHGVEIATAPIGDDLWAMVEGTFCKHAERGIDTFLIAELGPYVDLDLTDAFRFHKAKNQFVTPIHDADGPLRSWIVDSRAAASIQSFQFPHAARELRSAPVPYLATGYVNRLAEADDLRRFVTDAFLSRGPIRPSAREVKPGVWVDESAKIHNSARLLAPVYVGANAHLGRGVLVTQFSNVERCCKVRDGSAITDSSLLAYTGIGRALDVSNAVVNAPEFIDLRHKVTLNIDDPMLVFGTGPGRRLSGVRRDFMRQDREQPQLRLQYSYSDYFSRAAGRLFEVFRGEV